MRAGLTFSAPQFVVPQALTALATRMMSRIDWRMLSRVVARSGEKIGA
jgi:hypothetical protein